MAWEKKLKIAQPLPPPMEEKCGIITHVTDVGDNVKLRQRRVSHVGLLGFQFKLFLPKL